MQHPQFNTLTDQLNHIESLTGNGTELVSIAHPPENTIHALRKRIQTEHAQAENIKSDTTRSHVQQALNRADRIVQQYDTTPETGLAIYTGVIGDTLESYVFDTDDLPAPLNESQYRCANEFDTTPVRTITEPDETYGLLVVERGRAVIGELRGETITTHHEFESQVMGKTRAGGQSAQRFARERERQADEFFQEVARTATTTFLGDNGDITVTGVLIGGTLATAKQFAQTNHLDHRLRDNVIGVYSVEYATEHGLEQLVTAGEADILTDEHAEARDTVEAFFSALATTEKVTYGYDSVQQAATYGAVETLLVSNTVPEDDRTSLTSTVTQHGGDVVRIPDETEKGAAFTRTFNGIGALLRFPVEN